MCLGTDKTEVEKKFWDAVRGLREAGLTVHEIEFSESTVTMLGWQIEEKGVLRPTYKRIWRIRIAIRELLSRERMTWTTAGTFNWAYDFCVTLPS